MLELQNEKKRIYLVEKRKEIKLEIAKLVEQISQLQMEMENLLIDIDFIVNFDSFVDEETLKVKMGFNDFIERRNSLVVSYEMKQKEKQYEEQRKVIYYK